MTSEVSSAPVWARDYHSRVADIQRQFAAIPTHAPVRLAKKTSNLFRQRAATDAPGLDVSAFDGVLEVDPVNRTAEVLGMTTYEHLVDATLPYGLAPLCVPQLKTITLGGAVTGLGIESASFRAGLPHESVLEMDILTGDGRVLTVTAAPDDPHRDLFFAFPNSYGSLGYALRLKIELEPVLPYVHLTHVRFDSAAEMAQAMASITESGEWNGVEVDYLDGTVFSAHEQYLTLGRKTAERAGLSPSDYTGMDVYYRSVQNRREDLLTIHDYLWRWDTDWFWCSRAFGTQKRLIRRLWPKSKLRSDVYWKIIAWDRRTGFSTKTNRLRQRPARASKRPSASSASACSMKLTSGTGAPPRSVKANALASRAAFRLTRPKVERRTSHAGSRGDSPNSTWNGRSPPRHLASQALSS